MSAWVLGRRKGVHEDTGVSRADRPIFRDQCNVDATPNEGGLGVVEEPLTDAELARIVRETPRRLCGHCFGVVDR